MEVQYKHRNCLNNVTFTLLIMNRGIWNWFRLKMILNNNDIKQTTWDNHIISLERQYKPRNCLNNVTFTLLIMNRGKWNWFRLETILNNNNIMQTLWVNLIISLEGQYKPRNCLNNVKFTLLIMNRGDWNWFRLEKILNDNDIKKTSWVNFIVSLERQYKPRNCLNNVTFTLLIINRGNWNWFRLEMILNNNDIKKTSWVNLLLSLEGQYKPRHCLNNVTFTLLIMNRGKWNWFRLELIKIIMILSKHRELTCNKLGSTIQA